jgi:hypothetical protein
MAAEAPTAAAGQPGIEDVLLGAIPGLPKVNLHNKVLSPTPGGEEFLASQWSCCWASSA